MNHPTEPTSDMRQTASTLWQIYVALTSEGFTEKQALAIIGHMLAATGSGDES